MGLCGDNLFAPFYFFAALFCFVSFCVNNSNFYNPKQIDWKKWMAHFIDDDLTLIMNRSHRCAWEKSANVTYLNGNNCIGVLNAIADTYT